MRKGIEIPGDYTGGMKKRIYPATARTKVDKGSPAMHFFSIELLGVHAVRFDA
jgi:hypothetical protein